MPDLRSVGPALQQLLADDGPFSQGNPCARHLAGRFLTEIRPALKAVAALGDRPSYNFLYGFERRPLHPRGDFPRSRGKGRSARSRKREHLLKLENSLRTHS
jgi:hypothetical protein